MKTFILALLLLALVIGFVIWNTVSLSKTLDELTSLILSLPETADRFTENKETEAQIDEIYALWRRSFFRLTLTGAYENINRADEAIGSLYIHCKNGSGEEFAHARRMALDSLKNISQLESVSLQSIF